jgi:hypothetical protein
MPSGPASASRGMGRVSCTKSSAAVMGASTVVMRNVSCVFQFHVCHHHPPSFP